MTTVRTSKTQTPKGVLIRMVLVLMIATFFAVANAGAATITVPDDHATIQQAVNAAVSGDTVYVRAGIYYERIAMINKSVHLQGEGRSTTVIDAGGSGNVIYLSNVNNVCISELAIQNGDCGIYTYVRTTHNAIANCEIRNNKNYGIDLHDTGNRNNAVLNCNVWGNGKDGINGYRGSNSTLVDGCVLHDNGRFGFHIGWSSDWRVENTLIHSNATAGIGIDTASDGTIEDCEIHSNSSGVYFQHGLGQYRNTIVGNSIHSNAFSGIHFNAASRNNLVTENEIYGNEYGVYINRHKLQYANYNNVF